MSTRNPSEILTALERDHPLTALAPKLAAMWHNGWQPLDVARLLADHPAAATVYTDLVTLDRAGWHPDAAPVWTDHAAQLSAHREAWWDPDRPYWAQAARHHGLAPAELDLAAEILTLVLSEPHQLPCFDPPPSEPARQGAQATDAGVLAKVRALLAKAESTTFDEEAEALSAKAQELIARHAIDLALLAADVDVPGGRRLYLDAPYTKPKFILLAGIAEANNCRTAWNTRRSTATLIGHQSDMQLTEMLFTSLLLQGTGAVVGAGPQRDWAGRASTRSWRNAFWYGFAYRIGERLRQASATARSEAVEAAGEDLLPVLAARTSAVDQAFEDAFPSLGNLDISLSNAQGLDAGRSFADRAELSADHSVAKSGRRALPA